MNDTSTPQLESGEDLAKKALSAAEQAPQLGAGTTPAALPSDDDEVAASNQLAESLSYLQQIIERNAQELNKLKEELKHKQEGLRSVFENDSQLAEAQEQVSVISQQVKERKSQLQNSPQATQLKSHIKELREQKKEIEETLSNHLVNYYSLTNSTSFDTSDGDQWEFQIKARVSSRKS